MARMPQIAMFLITLTVNEFLKRCFGVELTPEQEKKFKELEGYPPTLQVTLVASEVPGDKPGQDSAEVPDLAPPIEPVGDAGPSSDSGQAEATTEPVTDPAPEVEPVTEPAPEVEPIPEVEPVTEPAPEVEPVTEPAPEVEPLTEPAPEVDTVTEPAPEVDTVTEPAPEVDTVTEPAPEVDNVTEPAPEVDPVTEPAPEPVVQKKPRKSRL